MIGAEGYSFVTTPIQNPVTPMDSKSLKELNID